VHTALHIVQPCLLFNLHPNTHTSTTHTPVFSIFSVTHTLIYHSVWYDDAESAHSFTYCTAMYTRHPTSQYTHLYHKHAFSLSFLSHKHAFFHSFSFPPFGRRALRPHLLFDSPRLPLLLLRPFVPLVPILAALFLSDHLIGSKTCLLSPLPLPPVPYKQSAIRTHKHSCNPPCS
jgi:hypothetical protein